MSSTLFADKKPTTPEEQSAARIAELKEKVARDSERDLCINSSELVRELVEQFDREMTAGKLEPAQQTLTDIGTYAEKAKDGAKNSRHKLKQAELILHKSSRRLADIGQSLAVENRPAIMAVVQRIEAADDEILNQVFKH
ncbi:MAG TPA: hypothetical protein VJ453_03290 [Terriglobales bacterium]|jgi:hypothetical protein|nr:hypothetical protein [Terriglobales bacterium]